MDAPQEAVVETNPAEAQFDLEAVFYAQYARLVRVIAAVIKDPARAEDLAVEVFLKWSRTPAAQGENAEGWLYRASVRAGLDELRRKNRRSRYEGLLGFLTSRTAAGPPMPDELFAAQEEQQRVRLVLSVIQPKQAELLVLQSHGLSYDELAGALDLNPASIGTLLSRAQQAFRKEYVRRYEKRRSERGRHGEE